MDTAGPICCICCICSTNCSPCKAAFVAVIAFTGTDAGTSIGQHLEPNEDHRHLPAGSPTEDDSRLARESSRKLGPYAEHALRVRIEDSNDVVELPALAVGLLLDLLAVMAEGNAVTLIPVHAELTTQQAADLIGVSRHFIIVQLESGKIAFRMVGTHRRIPLLDLMAYKRRMDAERTKALGQLAKQAQDLGMGY